MSQNGDKKVNIREWVAIAVSLLIGIGSLTIQLYVANKQGQFQQQLIQVQNASNRAYNSGQLEVSCSLDDCSTGIQIRNSGLSSAKNVRITMFIQNGFGYDYGHFTDNIQNYIIKAWPPAVTGSIERTNDTITFIIDNIPSMSSLQLTLFRNELNTQIFEIDRDLTIYSDKPVSWNYLTVYGSLFRYFNAALSFVNVNVTAVCLVNCIGDTMYGFNGSFIPGGGQFAGFGFSLAEILQINPTNETKSVEINQNLYQGNAFIKIKYLLPQGFKAITMPSPLYLRITHAETAQENISQCQGPCSISSSQR